MNPASRHQCLIYAGSPLGHLESVVPIIIEKLKTNHRCLYLHRPAVVAEMRTSLGAAGLDVESEVKKGALILSSDQNHLEGGKFNGVRMINLLRKAVDEALADGYTALWASGDMAWEFGGTIDADELINYEYALEEFMEQNQSLSGICQYHRDTIPHYALQIALITHKNIRVNNTPARQNPHYQEISDLHTAEEMDKALEGLASAPA